MGPARPRLRLHEPHIAGGADAIGHRGRPRSGLGRLTVVLVVAWLGVMIAGGWALAASQTSSRRAVAARLQSRTAYAASFLSIYARDLLTREAAAGQSWFADPRISVDELAGTATALGLSSAVVLDAQGRAIVTVPVGAASAGAARQVIQGASSDIALTTADGKPAVSFAVAYPSASGRRVFSGTYAMDDTVIPTVLGHVLSTAGWRAELVDAQGGRLTAGGPGAAAGAQAQFSAAVAGTSWWLVVRDPEAQLYGFLNGPGRWLAWLALTGLAVAGLAIIVLIARLAGRRTQLTMLNRELARLAAVDPLTGLRNRRAIEEFLQEALSAARRHELDLSVLVVDVDHFKNFNDTLGHRTGDAVLAHTAQVLDGALRTEDAIGRWGGEEFLVVLSGTDEEGALHATERLRAALATDQPEEARAHGLAVTITIGLAEWGEESMYELVTRADSALYLGKAAGRDTVQVAPALQWGVEAA